MAFSTSVSGKRKDHSPVTSGKDEVEPTSPKPLEKKARKSVPLIDDPKLFDSALTLYKKLVNEQKGRIKLPMSVIQRKNLEGSATFPFYAHFLTALQYGFAFFRDEQPTLFMAIFFAHQAHSDLYQLEEDDQKIIVLSQGTTAFLDRTFAERKQLQSTVYNDAPQAQGDFKTFVTIIHSMRDTFFDATLKDTVKMEKLILSLIEAQKSHQAYYEKMGKKSLYGYGFLNELLTALQNMQNYFYAHLTPGNPTYLRNAAQFAHRASGYKPFLIPQLAELLPIAYAVEEQAATMLGKKKLLFESTLFSKSFLTEKPKSKHQLSIATHLGTRSRAASLLVSRALRRRNQASD